MEERRNTPQYEKSPLKWRYNFTKVFFTFWKTVKMYGGENERIDEEIATLRAVLDFFFQTQDALTITFDGIDVKIDRKYRIRGRRADDVYFEDLYDLFTSICLAEVNFRKGVSDAELLSLFRTIGKFPLGREPKLTTYERFIGMIPEQLPHIDLIPYDPEEAGNLPLYTVSQRIANIYTQLAEEFVEQRKILQTNDTLPLKVVERSVQDLLTILLMNQHTDMWDFALFLATAPSFNGSVDAAEAVNRLFLTAAVTISLSIDKIESKYLLLSAFYHTLASSPQKAFFSISRMSTFYIGRIVAAVSAATKLPDFHDSVMLSSDARQSSIAGEVLKVVDYYLAVTNPMYRQAAQIDNFLSRTAALKQMQRLAIKKGFYPEIVSALVKSVGTPPIGSLATYAGGSKIALVTGRPQNATDGLVPIFTLNHTMEIVDQDSVPAAELVPTPAEQLIPIPAETFTDIANSFFEIVSDE